jgi:hypothetical protein
MDLADVFRRHGPAYLDKYGATMLPSHRAAIDAILSCHTPARGGSLYACEGCGASHFAYHRCGHRACGQCGQAENQAWVDRQQQRLLPVPYFLVTFTVPAELRGLFRSHQRLCYDLLLSESAGALQDVAQTPKHLGGRLGLLGVLHTWTRELAYHPHVHYLVPGIAEGPDRTPCFPSNPEYLLPARVLSARFKSRLQTRLRTGHPELYARIPAQAWKHDFVVDMAHVGSGSNALNYLSRYIYKTAISSARLVWQSDTHVCFSYRDSNTGEEKEMVLTGEEFIRRFLQHVLPKGFRRVRTYGWLSPAAKVSFERLSAFLGVVRLPRTVIKPKVTITCGHCQKPMRMTTRIRRTPLICRPP